MAEFIDRQQIEDEIERLIGILDMVDPDPDLEPSLGGNGYTHLGIGWEDLEGDNSDSEPSLGAHEASWKGPYCRSSVALLLARNLRPDVWEGMEPDRTSESSQVTWGAGDCEDFELDDCDDEEGDNGIGDDGGLYPDLPADHGFPGALFGESVGRDPKHNPHKVPVRDVHDDLSAAAAASREDVA